MAGICAGLISFAMMPWIEPSYWKSYVDAVCWGLAAGAAIYALKGDR